MGDDARTDEPKIAVVAHQALNHGVGSRHRSLERSGVKPYARPRMADANIVAHALRADTLFRRGFVRQLRQQNFQGSPAWIATILPQTQVQQPSRFLQDTLLRREMIKPTCSPA